MKLSLGDGGEGVFKKILVIVVCVGGRG